MDYYEVYDAYYAMIKAKSRDEAYQLYVGTVADDSDKTVLSNIVQVSKDFALAKYAVCVAMSEYNKGNMNISELVNDINNDTQMVLLIEGNLI